ncbi:hypothetical protein TRFO_34429 [Tritrichomonas foetus]|uniref:Leucine Rich Repeat family protein n=1 Tax=Tritrichomonas foetus TaxID=1144522 RepID=A0A1J4JJ23_9EUKA|nr:hypothetical protein TRFO_34429 [Tritrichomonas foetus]|eukprot:OHS99184.1 hypothetical protein TRFO_34429 [Tritrichomonas foetus]
MDNIIKAVETVEFDGSTAIYGGYVTLKGCFGFQKKFISLITETKLFLMSPKGNKIRHSFNLMDIESIIFGPQTIHIEVDQMFFSFLSKEVYDFSRNMIYALQHLLTTNELNIIKNNIIDKNDSNSPLVSIPSAYGSFCRMMTLSQNPHFKISQKDTEKLKFVLLCRRKEIDFSSFDDPEAIAQIFVKILPLCDFVKHITINKMNQNAFLILQPLIGEKNSLEALTIDIGQTLDISSSFEDFIRVLRDNSNSILQYLSFKDIKFTTTHLQIIQDCIHSRSINSLEFRNCIKETDFPFLYNDFLPTLEITSLSLDDTPNIDINSLLPNIQNIQTLSLTNCGIYINEFLLKLSEYKDHKLTNLILSKNYIQHTKEIIKIPREFISFTANEIEFQNNSFVWLLNLLLKNMKNGSHLSICSSTADESEWESVNLFLQRVNAIQLKSLKWDGNRISNGFITFLFNQHQIEELSLSGCFHQEESKEYIYQLGEFFRNNKNLKEFTCKRFNKISLTFLTKSMIDALTGSYIEIIDISNNYGGEDCYESLFKLLERNTKPIKALVYDGVHPSSKENLLEFIQKVEKNNFQKVTSFPLHDLEFLYQTNRIDHETIRNIIDKCLIPLEDDYIHPFSVFYYEKFHLSNFISQFETRQKTCLFHKIQQNNNSKLFLQHENETTNHNLNENIDRQRSKSFGSKFGTYKKENESKNSKQATTSLFCLSDDEKENIPDKTRNKPSIYSTLYANNKTGVDSKYLESSKFSSFLSPSPQPSQFISKTNNNFSSSPIGERKLQAERPPPIDISFLGFSSYVTQDQENKKINQFNDNHPKNNRNNGEHNKRNVQEKKYNQKEKEYKQKLNDKPANRNRKIVKKVKRGNQEIKPKTVSPSQIGTKTKKNIKANATSFIAPKAKMDDTLSDESDEHEKPTVHQKSKLITRKANINKENHETLIPNHQVKPSIEKKRPLKKESPQNPKENNKTLNRSISPPKQRKRLNKSQNDENVENTKRRPSRSPSPLQVQKIIHKNQNNVPNNNKDPRMKVKSSPPNMNRENINTSQDSQKSYLISPRAVNNDQQNKVKRTLKRRSKVVSVSSSDSSQVVSLDDLTGSMITNNNNYNNNDARNNIRNSEQLEMNPNENRKNNQRKRTKNIRRKAGTTRNSTQPNNPKRRTLRQKSLHEFIDSDVEHHENLQYDVSQQHNKKAVRKIIRRNSPKTQTLNQNQTQTQKNKSPERENEFHSRTINRNTNQPNNQKITRKTRKPTKRFNSVKPAHNQQPNKNNSLTGYGDDLKDIKEREIPQKRKMKKIPNKKVEFIESDSNSESSPPQFPVEQLHLNSNSKLSSEARKKIKRYIIFTSDSMIASSYDDIISDESES